MARRAFQLSHVIARGPLSLALVDIVLSGCSINLGSLTSSSGEPESVKPTSQGNITSLSETIKNNPNDAQAYVNRGLIYRQTKRLDQAMADYEWAIALDASDATAYLGRGLVYKARNQPEEALADFNKAIALAPDNAEVYYNRGLLYQDQKQHQYAIDDFTVANGLVPQQAGPLLARAMSYLATDHP